eukprot:TRINITY_DN17120_c3_g1_i1.p1 TRINITY_DN17120_c3_g1~~TRINITY_DN17120_c3_g1_i1.p1  ORF type:complete len:187 (+),score=52.02 TRINITY_DN17120_c3_g1_i1:80-562(+)
MKISVVLHHAKRRKGVEVETKEPVVRIMEAAWEAFSVPVSQQRVIYKGKSLDPDLLIEALGLVTGAKLLISGEAVVKGEDTAVACKEHEQTYAQLLAGFDAATTRTAIGAIGEGCQRVLEKLDQLSIPQSDPENRAVRKQLVVRLQQLQEKVDTRLSSNL